MDADTVQQIVDQLSETQPNVLANLIAILLPQIGIIIVVFKSLNKRIKEYEDRTKNTERLLIALSRLHDSDESKFATGPSIELLETLVKANENQHSFNVWVGNGITMIVKKLGQISYALTKQGIKISGDTDADLLALDKPPERR